MTPCTDSAKQKGLQIKLSVEGVKSVLICKRWFMCLRVSNFSVYISLKRAIYGRHIAEVWR